MFDSGISKYIKAKATVEVCFPGDEKGNEYICCMRCKFYSGTSGRCRLTEEVVPFPSKYVGGLCPLEQEI
jgi:hypothetical protein